MAGRCQASRRLIYRISVYEDQLQFWNEGHLPDSWTVENLLRKHPSKPFNPDVATTLFRAGYIESWGWRPNRKKNT